MQPHSSEPPNFPTCANHQTLTGALRAAVLIKLPSREGISQSLTVLQGPRPHYDTYQLHLISCCIEYLPPTLQLAAFKMTIFRPCIDIHAGQVKQIVGGTLSDGSDDSSSLKTNHVSLHSATYFAQLYRCYGLRGGHVIMLGPHNEQAAKEALQSWPQGLHIGGGITDINAEQWITSGAEKVIVTSFLFPDGTFSQSRLQSCLKALGDDRNKLVVDLSCRRKGSTWYVATDKWQTLTSYEISAGITFPPSCLYDIAYAL